MGFIEKEILMYLWFHEGPTLRSFSNAVSKNKTCLFFKLYWYNAMSTS